MLADGVCVGVIRPALSPHDVMRLRGCLTDATANRATAKILGDGQAALPPCRTDASAPAGSG